MLAAGPLSSDVQQSRESSAELCHCLALATCPRPIGGQVRNVPGCSSILLHIFGLPRVRQATFTSPLSTAHPSVPYARQPIPYGCPAGVSINSLFPNRNHRVPVRGYPSGTGMPLPVGLQPCIVAAAHSMYIPPDQSGVCATPCRPAYRITMRQQQRALLFPEHLPPAWHACTRERAMPASLIRGIE